MMSSCSDVRPYVFGPLVLPTTVLADREPEPPFGGPAGAGGPGSLLPDPQPPSEPPPDFEALAAAAQAEGYEAGYAAGLAQAQAEQQAMAQQLAALAGQALLDAHHYAATLEEQLVALSLAVAEKVIERELQTDPALVEGVIRAALAEVQDATIVAVLVHPDDQALLEERWDALVRQALPAAVALREVPQLVSDESVQPGGCVIQTRVGQVDAQLATKLAELSATFKALREGGAA
jgi:flagellar assembly protein FliH